MLGGRVILGRPFAYILDSLGCDVVGQRIQLTTFRFHPRVVWQSSDHLAWVLIQQLVVRAAQALKFLLAARWLGPELYALVAVAMTVFMVVEALSDTGLGPAMIQRASTVNAREAGAVWTFQMSRGLMMAAVLVLFSHPAASLFQMPDSAWLIACYAAVPLLRNAAHPGYVLLQRDRRFKTQAGVEASGAVLDCLTTVVALSLGAGPVAMLLGTLLADTWRAAWSYALPRPDMHPNLAWRSIAGLVQFGFWVWSTSVVAVLLNQFDKVLVSRWLGALEFGLYQTSAKIAQMAVNDLPTAAAQHAFATLSRLHHDDEAQAHKAFVRYLVRVAVGAGAVALVLASAAPWLLSTFLGAAWLGAAPILRAQALAMWVGALIAITVAHVRAMGRPQWVVQSVLAQACVLVALAVPAIDWQGAFGMALAASLAGALAWLWLMFQIWALRRRSLRFPVS